MLVYTFSLTLLCRCANMKLKPGVLWLIIIDWYIHDYRSEV